MTTVIGRVSFDITEYGELSLFSDVLAVAEERLSGLDRPRLRTYTLTTSRVPAVHHFEYTYYMPPVEE